MVYLEQKTVRHLLLAAVVALLVLNSDGRASVIQPSLPQEQAAFLAGIPLSKRCILYPLQKSPQYLAYQKEIQEQWGFCRKIRYGAMQQWAKDHLARYPATRGILRYLFGGPDFLNAFAFFPDTRTMVLGGLEPVGEVPPPEALDLASLGTALQALQEALHTSLFCGFFITSEMKPQLTLGSFRGVLPVLYTELALTGNVIESVAMIRPFGSPGVEIIYHRPGGPPQTLYYFQADISNGKECRRFLSWLDDLGPGASYLKAASYLLPLDSFSETRNFLMRTSLLILQDDSGLPFRSFLPGDWQIQLFGVYTEPLPIFNLGKDPRLAEAYQSGLRAGSLPFGAGYHVQPDDANLLLAVRCGAIGADRLPSTPRVSTTPITAELPAPTPKPKPIRIRKALPVTIKKAISVPTPTPAPTPKPIPSPLQELTPAPTPEKTPETDFNQIVENPHKETNNSGVAEAASIQMNPVEAFPSPKATPTSTPEPTATPSPTPAPSNPEVQSTPVPAQSGNSINTNAETAPSPSNTSTAAPEQKAPEAAPASTPIETPQPATAEMPKASPEASSEPAAPAPSATGTTN